MEVGATAATTTDWLRTGRLIKSVSIGKDKHKEKEARFFHIKEKGKTGMNQ